MPRRRPIILPLALTAALLPAPALAAPKAVPAPAAKLVPPPKVMPTKAIDPADERTVRAAAGALKVASIAFAGETQDLDLVMLRELVTLHEGLPYESARVRESLANLYQTGKFEGLDAAWKADGTGGADVTFTVRRARLVTAWSFSGNGAVNGETLTRAMDLTWGAPLDRARFSVWSRAIHDRYLREGYPRAKAEFVVQLDAPGRAELEVRVDEGEPVRIRNLVIDAAGKLDAADIRRTLGIGPTDRLERERVFEGVERIQRSLASRGWVGGRVDWYFALPDGKRESNHGAVIAAGPAFVDLHVAVAQGQRALVEVDGENLLPQEDLARAITIYERHSISPFELDASAEKLREQYIARGYVDAEVTHTVVKLEDGPPRDPKNKDERYRVTFKVEAGRRTVVQEINFAGNQAYGDETLRRTLSTHGPGRFFGGSAFDPGAWADDLANLEAFYESHGFLAAKVVGVDRTLQPKSDLLVLTVHLAEGPRTAIGRILVPGLTDAELAGVMTALPVNPGEPYNPRRLPEWVSSVQSYFAKSGYPLAKVMAKVDPGNDPQDATLRFSVVKGPAKAVGRVVVRGNVKTQDAVVQRQISLNAGDPYDAEELFRTQQAIYQLGFFDRVSVEPIHPISEDPDEPVDLVVALHERETGWIGLGGGYGLQQGPQISAEFLQNNVGGTGRPLRLEGVFSAPRRNLQASLRDPYLLGSSLIGEVGASYLRERRQVDQPLVESYGPTVGFSRQLSNALFGSLKYGWGRSTYLEFSPSDLAANGGKTERVNSVVTGGLTYDTRSDLLNPRWGTKADLILDLGTPLLNGSLTYTRPRLVVTHHIPLPRRIVFAIGGELGYIRPLAGPYLLPYDLLFLAGGANSLRGYEFNKVGQVGPDGKTIGGELMAVTHAEARIPVWGDVGVVGFVDAGNVWPRLQDFSLGSFRTSAGLGLRYNTPVGPVRIDYGVRVAPEFEWPGLEGLYLGLGHAF